MSAILEVGRNCWRRERAERIAFLVDGAAYFAALADALPRAREQVLIVGWDVDGRMQLRRDGTRDHPPDNLRELLNYVVAQRPELHVYVLLWDFAVIYALEREPLPSVNLGLRTADRVHVALDSSAPVGGCRHEKIVVIDDRVAFCGGIDLANTRWDTPEHAPDDPRRVMPDGSAYQPFHDVQAAVSGDAAAALGEHCRERWRLATGESLPAPEVTQSDPWPPDLAAEAEEVSVAVARTVPADEHGDGVREVRQLNLDAIAAAERYVYMENQYFTSRAIGTAIAERLREKDGPEFVLVMPERASGWLEEQTMGLLRAQLIHRLEASDEHGRLRIYTPVLEGVTQGLKVHAKVLVVDDFFARVGSSNLTDRSQGLDSECDLAIEAEEGDTQTRRVVASLCHRLVGEHLGVDAQTVRDKLASTGSLVETVEALAGGGRTLAALRPAHEDMPAAAALVAAVSDPDRPLDGTTVAEEFRDRVVEGAARFSGVLSLLAIALAVVALALAWRFTGLADYVDVDTAMGWLERLRASTVAPLGLMVIYLVTGLVAFPVTILNVATAIAFGPWLGFGYALAGSMASAALTFAIGRRLGGDVIRRFSSGAVYQAVHAIGRRGFLAVLSCRLVPIAPFTVINLVSGAMPIGVRDYLLGTFVGMAPGIAVLAAFGDRVQKVLEDPNLLNLALLALVVVLWLALGWGLGRLVRRRGMRSRGE